MRALAPEDRVGQPSGGDGPAGDIER
jgi:hypothetical protein